MEPGAEHHPLGRPGEEATADCGQDQRQSRREPGEVQLRYLRFVQGPLLDFHCFFKCTRSEGDRSRSIHFFINTGLCYLFVVICEVVSISISYDHKLVI